MSKLVICKTCRTKISEDAKTCPKCGAPNKKRGGCLKVMGYGLIGFFVLLIISAISKQSKDSSSDAGISSRPASSGSARSAVNSINIGDVITTPKFEITVSSLVIRTEVGTDFFKSTAPEGAVYVTIQWEYKNISDKPASSFHTPRIHLKDPKGTKYKRESGASASFATEVKLDRKIFSDVNPGIKVKDADIFKVSKELLAKGGWRIIIAADKDIEIPIKQ